MVILIVILVVLTILGFKIDREYQRSVIFRLGRFHQVKDLGLYWIIPFVDRRKQIDMRTMTVDIESQETVTKDSVTIRVNAVLYFKIYEPEKAIIEIRDFMNATYQALLTALRNVIGQHHLIEKL